MTLGRQQINLSNFFAPVYHNVISHIMSKKYYDIVMWGGRSSLKGTTAYTIMLLLLHSNPKLKFLVISYKENTVINVVEQINDTIGFINKKSQELCNENIVSEFIYKKSSYKEKLSKQSISFSNGAIVEFSGLVDGQKGGKKYDYVIIDELGEVNISSYAKLEQTINSLSATYKRNDCQFIYIGNPVRQRNAFFNDFIMKHLDLNTSFCLKTTMYDVPKEYNSPSIWAHAEGLKETNILAYRNNYLGEMVGYENLVFNNIEEKRITEEEVAEFESLGNKNTFNSSGNTNVYCGIDWGFTNPASFVKLIYFEDTKEIYIYDEVYGYKMGTDFFCEQVFKKIKSGQKITVDNAEPKTISRARQLGLNVEPAKKGKNSIEAGVSYLADNVKCIYIDRKRCPNTYSEFTSYEYAINKFGERDGRLSDVNNHSIDAVRYAIEGLRIAPVIKATGFTWKRKGRK